MRAKYRPDAQSPTWTRRKFLKTAATASFAAVAAPTWASATPLAKSAGLFPTTLRGKDWVQFEASGFSHPVCGVIYRMEDTVTNGMALGGIDTGCLDFENSGLLGYCTIFNSHVPRRGPINLPLLGLATAGKSWALCRPPDSGKLGESFGLERVSAWLPGDLGADQPAWKSSSASVPGWFRSVGRSHHDLPAGKIACHSSAVLRWTSPISGEIRIHGGIWQARDFKRDQHWELARNGVALASGILLWGPTSAEPLSVTPPSNGSNGFSITVNKNDLIELVVGENSPGDFVGVNFAIVTASGDRTWDAARDWSEASNASGPWTFDDYRGTLQPITSLDLRNAGISTAQQIHYWGHYPVLDVEFETDAPVQVGMRAWTPFLPGDVVNSMVPRHRLRDASSQSKCFDSKRGNRPDVSRTNLG